MRNGLQQFPSQTLPPYSSEWLPHRSIQSPASTLVALPGNLESTALPSQFAPKLCSRKVCYELLFSWYPRWRLWHSLPRIFKAVDTPSPSLTMAAAEKAEPAVPLSPLFIPSIKTPSSNPRKWDWLNLICGGCNIPFCPPHVLQGH